MMRGTCLFLLLLVAGLSCIVLLSAATGPADSSSAGQLQPLVLFDFGKGFEIGTVTVADAEVSLSAAGTFCASKRIPST